MSSWDRRTGRSQETGRLRLLSRWVLALMGGTRACGSPGVVVSTVFAFRPVGAQPGAPEPYDLCRGVDVPMLICTARRTSGAPATWPSDGGADAGPRQGCTLVFYDGARHGLPYAPTPAMQRMRRSRASTRLSALARYLPVLDRIDSDAG